MRYINLHLHYITLHIMPRLAQQHYIQRAVAELDEQIIELRRRQRTDVHAAEHEKATVRTHMAMCDSWYHFHIPPITSVNVGTRRRPVDGDDRVRAVACRSKYRHWSADSGLDRPASPAAAAITGASYIRYIQLLYTQQHVRADTGSGTRPQ